MDMLLLKNGNRIGYSKETDARVRTAGKSPRGNWLVVKARSEKAARELASEAKAWGATVGYYNGALRISP